MSCFSFENSHFQQLRHKKYTLVNQHNNGKWTPIDDYFPIEHGDIFQCYVSLPEGIPRTFRPRWVTPTFCLEELEAQLAATQRQLKVNPSAGGWIRRAGSLYGCFQK